MKIFTPAAQPGTAWSAPKWLRYFAYFTCAYVLCLIFLGGQVKSHEAGLAVPDWPLTYGQNPITYPISEWKGGIFHEHFHRLVAGVAGMLTLALSIALFLASTPKWLRLLGMGTVAAVIAQAVLGGLTVWYQLPVAISSMHGTLGQTYLLLNVILAYSLSLEFERRKAGALSSPLTRHAFRLALILIALLYAQLLLGALTRHTESGLAVPDFPTTGGQWLPVVNEENLAWVNDWRFEKTLETGNPLLPVAAWQMWLHLAHRAGALIVSAYIFWLAWHLRRSHAEYTLAAKTTPWLVALVLVQVGLGITVIWTSRIPIITSFHVATGAALLGLAVFLALRSYPLSRTSVEPR